MKQIHQYENLCLVNKEVADFGYDKAVDLGSVGY